MDSIPAIEFEIATIVPKWIAPCLAHFPCVATIPAQRDNSFMATWKIAAVQMDCRLGAVAQNLAAIRSKLREAAGQGARLVVFPEGILSGYCFTSKEEAWAHAETIPGPSTLALAQDCRELGVWSAVGMLEARPSEGAMYNACALIGPNGVAATYRKIHLPFLGVDRFTTPGDQPFA